MAGKLNSWQTLVSLKMAGQYRMLIRLLKTRELNDIADGIVKLLSKIDQTCQTAIEHSTALNESIKGDDTCLLKSAAKLIIELSVTTDCKHFEELMNQLSAVETKLKEQGDEDAHHVLRVFSKALNTHVSQTCKLMSLKAGEKQYEFRMGQKLRNFENYRSDEHSIEEIAEGETNEPMKETISVLCCKNHTFNIKPQMKRLVIESSSNLCVKSHNKVLSSIEMDKTYDTQVQCLSVCGTVILDRCANISIEMTKDNMEGCKIAVGQSPSIHLKVEAEPGYSRSICNYMMGCADKKLESLETKEATEYNLYAIKV